MIPAFKSILDLQKAFPNEQSCIDHLERLSWGGNPVSPFDPNSKVYKCKDNKYKCKNTGKYFNVRTGSIFDNTKIKLEKWFLALYVFSSHKKGISSHQLAKDIDVTQKTAWFLLHRLRYAFDHPNFHGTKKGTVEIDEVYIGGKMSNKHKKVRAKHKEYNATHLGNKVGVMGIMERGKDIKFEIIDSSKQTMKEMVRQNVDPSAHVMTDSLMAYRGLDKQFASHEVIYHDQNEYVRGRVHTNTVEGMFSHLKRGIYGIYHHVSKFHLISYCNEFSLRLNTRDLNVQSRFDMILSAIAGKRLTYQNLIQNGK